MMILRLAFITLILMNLVSCLPAMFTAAGKTTYEAAKDRSAGRAVDDIKLSTSIKGNYMKSSFHGLYNRVDVEVLEGRVLLTGKVTHEDDMMKAVQIAWDHDGVKEVINEIKVDEKSREFSVYQYTRDTFITSQVKSKILGNRTIKFVNYTVITIDDVVYLFGKARSDDELSKVSEIAATVKGVKKVISHVQVENKEEG